MTKSFETFITKFSWFCYGGTVGAAVVTLVAVILIHPTHPITQRAIERPVVQTNVSYEPAVFVPLPAKQLVPPESFARFMKQPPLPIKHRGRK